MGIVSGAALDAGGDVIGVTPYAMFASGGEGERVCENGSPSIFVKLGEAGRERVGVIYFHYILVTEFCLRWNGYERLHQLDVC